MFSPERFRRQLKQSASWKKQFDNFLFIFVISYVMSYTSNLLTESMSKTIFGVV